MTVPGDPRPVRLFELACEFDVTRRIEWSDEDLGGHIDDVFDRLHRARGVSIIEAEADLDSGRTRVLVRYSAAKGDEEPERLGRATLGVAIRSAGGGHVGLLTFAEEAAVKPEGSRWSGLRTPAWNVRQVTLREVQGEG